MRESDRAERVLSVLRRNFRLPEWTGSKTKPFEALIRTVLSQATNDRNRDRAFRNLSARFAITPEALAAADVKEIESAIRVGGLYRNKSRKIKALSKTVLERFEGSLDFIYSKPLTEARALLLTVPGVGPKTADVVLLFVAGKPTLPVDTHVNRVSRRLGLAPLKGGYEAIRGALEALYSPKDYLAAHLLFISLGRSFCRARNPVHGSCPVNSLCPVVEAEKAKPELHSLHGSRDFP